MRWRLAVVAATAVATLMIAAGTARAENKEDVGRAKDSFQAGATAYAAGDYLAAIQALEAAYALTPLPAIAFSLGQAERRQYFVAHDRKHLDRAIELFRRYVEQVPAGGRRADALDALSQLEPLAAATAAAAAAHAAGTAGAGPDKGEAALPRQTRLMITSETPGAELSLDEGPPSPSPLIREVEPGAHRARVSAEGFYPSAQEVTAVAGALIPLSVSLKEMPSTLAVTVPADAELYVDGAFASRSGGRLTLQLPGGSHHVTVAQRGHRVATRTVDMERGGTTTLHIALEQTRQRRIALGLFIAGGAVFGAGVVLGTLAVNAENGAQDFLDQRAQGNVSAGALAGYHDDVSARDRYRVASIVSFGASAGLLATALLLYQLDNPDSRELMGGERGPEGDRPPTDTDPTRLRLRVAPLASADGRVGAQVFGSF